MAHYSSQVLVNPGHPSVPKLRHRLCARQMTFGMQAPSLKTHIILPPLNNTTSKHLKDVISDVSLLNLLAFNNISIYYEMGSETNN